MENQSDVERKPSILEQVIRDVFDVVKFSKEAEIAFEDFYAEPDWRKMIDVMNSVSGTDFYLLKENEQTHVAFTIGLLSKSLLENKVGSNSRSRFEVCPNVSFIGVLANRYMSGDKKHDENLRDRIVKIADCNSVGEIVEYIRANLIHYIDRPFNAYWFVEDLIKAETNAGDVLKRWVVRGFLGRISGKNKGEEKENA